MLGSFARSLAVALGVLLLPSGVSHAGVDFRTPNKAAYCDYVPKGEIIEGGVPNPRPDIYCWTPNDGFTVQMYRTGKANKIGNAEQLEGAYAKVNRVLRFGQQFRKDGFVCTSRRNGLTCRNRSDHGWWLGRFVGYRMF